SQTLWYRWVAHSSSPGIPAAGALVPVLFLPPGPETNPAGVRASADDHLQLVEATAFCACWPAPIAVAAATMAFACEQLPENAARRAATAAWLPAIEEHLLFREASLQRLNALAAAWICPLRAALMQLSHAPLSPPDVLGGSCLGGSCLGGSCLGSVFGGDLAGALLPPATFSGGASAVGSVVGDSSVGAAGGSTTGATVTGPLAASAVNGLVSASCSSSGLIERAATTTIAMSSTAPSAPSPMSSPLPLPPEERGGAAGRCGATAGATAGGMPAGPGVAAAAEACCSMSGAAGIAAVGS